MMDRRTFLKSSGFLAVSFNMDDFSFTELPDATESQQGNRNKVDSWIRMETTGRVTVLTGKTELGQGIRTALMQIAAEELDVDMTRMHIVIAETGLTPDERYTAGSASIEGSGKTIRYAAATARNTLLKRASLYLNASMENLIVEDGTISNQTSGQQITYWQLLNGESIETEVDEQALLKDPASYKLVGTAYPREDITVMATAMPYFLQDIRLPGMVHARVLHPPGYGSTLAAIVTAEAADMPGVLKIIRDGSFIAVIAEEEYQAIKAWKTLSGAVEWNKQTISSSENRVFTEMQQQATEAEVIKEAAGFKEIYSKSSSRYEARYQRPYQMHGSIGPSCAIAQWKDSTLTVWSHTQGVYPLRKTLAHLLSLPENKIKAYSVAGSGCYGHNGADDAAAEAALLAMRMPGKPVRLQWMREDEHNCEPYGSAMMHHLTAGLGTDGRVQAWETRLWSDNHSSRPGGDAGHFLSARHLEKPFRFSPGKFSGGSHRNAEPLYNFEASRVVLHHYDGPLRTSALRSLGAYANVFAIESFMDELASHSGQDPVQFRLQHLQDDRAKDVIQLAAKKSKLEQRPYTEGTGKGIAFARYKNKAAYCAVVAEVKIDADRKTFKLTRLTAVIDAGQTINSDGLKNQTAGGMIQSASWTLFEQVRYDNNGITSSTWETYPIMRFEDVPETEVFIIDHPEAAPMGAGEAAQGPTAAAIANALFAATGKRIRSLPLTAEKVFQEQG